ncbi:MAG: ABC transporter ATP-binding protein [Desulfobacula sp.]|uniref:ABC transporter ATP-binding protein n=1 Tax=Desulfobacula sp. TaxID=2593537 RepID=UPI0025C3DDB6|nr:ABC transporter ATP-binding protein [Desulfobacula sp.]MCD4721747.1 ABC transporter ATP-binding protein [Desulfobacula sp.]
MEMDLIQINDLKMHFYLGKGLLSKLFGKGLRVVHAVDGVNLKIKKGHTFGLVGESGCGKSTLGQTIFRLLNPQSGEILFEGEDIFKMDSIQRHNFHQKAQLIFQDQFGCLNPRMTVKQIIAEPLIAYNAVNSSTDIDEKVGKLLEAVNLPSEAAYKFPNEFSGGQARRIGLARAIALDPSFIVADEPTSGLDISTAATILNLMQDLQESLGLTYLWISHNLNQVKYMSDDIAIMYLGKIVEMGKTEHVFNNLAHPYSQALISAMPRVGKTNKNKIILEGEIPSPISPPSGCRFRTRCRYAKSICSRQEPELLDIGSGHYAACLRLDSIPSGIN